MCDSDSDLNLKNKTLVTNMITEDTSAGAYKESNGVPAHIRLCKRIGEKPEENVGGSIKSDGSVELKSGSLNGTKFGTPDLRDVDPEPESAKIMLDAVENNTVKQYNRSGEEKL